MTVVRAIPDLRSLLAHRRAPGLLGLVPTMGALHDGHAALIRAARAAASRVVVSIFVNPAQFNDPSDLAAYPRTLAADEALAAAAGADVIFAPSAADMYPPGFATSIHVGGEAEGLEGAHRPGHFQGVATVCAKLFAIVAPDLAFFGQKDAQQVAVITRLVRDLNLPLAIRVIPTVRDADGLALSSRNARLSSDERRQAAAIPRALAAGLEASRCGSRVVEAARAQLGGMSIGYVDVVTLAGHPTLAIAVTVGGTRLIDNVPLDDPSLAGFAPHAEPQGARHD